MPNTETADTSDELSQDIRNALALIKAHPEPKAIAGELKGSPLYQAMT
jgi:hypothetical protein